ncbi:MAG: hypothetical protein AAGN82_10495 [Myxococcota bacterium]
MVAAATHDPGAARAEPSSSDGDYGRLDDDTHVAVEVGASVAVGADDDPGVSLAARVSWFYLRTVGLVAGYDESFDRDTQPLRRSFSGALEVRPLFLGRFASDLERGPAWADLTLDSLALSFGGWAGLPRDRSCPPRTCPIDSGIAAGLGLDLPLQPRANRLFVGLDARVLWTVDGARHREGASSLRVPPAFMLTLTLGYQHGWALGLVDAGDAVPP